MSIVLGFALAVAIAANDSTPAAATGAASAPGDTIAIVDVNVVPMDRERVLARQTVLIAGGRIAAMGERGRVRVPAGVRRVDGTGKYLTPGLIDMHVHVGAYTGPGVQRVPQLLGLLVSSGVTTARSMVGHATHLELRKALAGDSIVAPSMSFAAPQLTGPNATGPFAQFSVPTAAAATQKVQEYAAAGYDFIKVTFGLTPEVYDAIATATRQAKLPLSGHVVSDVGLARALAAGQQIEHLDAYLEAAVKDDAPVKGIVSQGKPGAILDHLDSRKIDSLARATARAGVYSTPTLAFFEDIFMSNVPADSLRAREDAAYWADAAVNTMIEGRAGLWATPLTPSQLIAWRQFRRDLTLALSKAGAKLMVGSDSPQQFNMLGFAAHRELSGLVAAGLTPYQALEAATRIPAEFLGASREVGTVQVGKRADLMLVGANPLENVTVLRRPEAVVLRGRWIDRPELDRLRDAAKVPR